MKNNEGKIKTLTMSAFGLALSVLSLLLFRGPISIVSTFLIPAIIVLFSGNKNGGYVLTSMGLLTVTLLFFPTQIIFVFGYIILGHFLKLLIIDSNQRVKLITLNFILYVIITTLVLFLGIRLTELIFLVPLHTMMLRISGSNPLLYLGILFFEGLLVSIFNFALLRLLNSRIDPS
ncbi:MAG: hypothetical protein NUK57_11615 [Gudongella sp.]|nr:hypothetical protein [Gudongella sp.]